MTLLTRFPGVVANPSGHKVVVGPPSAGVDDYAHRWIASRVDPSVAADTPVASVPDLGGSLPLAQSTAGAQPILRRAGAEAWLDFDGVDDSLRATFSSAQAQPFSFAMVARFQSTTTKTFARFGPLDVQAVVSDSNNTARIDVRPSTSTKSALTAGAPIPGSWHFIAGRFLGAAGGSQVVLDDVASVGSAAFGTAAVAASMVSVGDSAVGGVGFLDFDLAELITWGRAISVVEAATVRAAMKANHSTLALP